MPDKGAAPHGRHVGATTPFHHFVEGRYHEALGRHAGVSNAVVLAYARYPLRLKGRLLNDRNRPVDLTGASVDFRVEDQDGNVLLDNTARLEHDVNGEVAYEWRDGTIGSPGNYRAWFDVTYGDGSTETFPDSGAIDYTVNDRLRDPITDDPWSASQQSADGGTAVIEISHTSVDTPTAVSVEPASEDASSDYWVSDVTSADLELTYPTATPTGGANLDYRVITLSQSTTASEPDVATISGDGSTRTFSLSHSLGETPTAASVQHANQSGDDGTTDFWITGKTASAVEITYAAAPPSGTDNVALQLITSTDATYTATPTVDGNDAQRTYSLGHDFGATPTAAAVTARSEDASTDFWVTDLTASTVEVTYPTPPPHGTGNLAYDVIVQ